MTRLIVEDTRYVEAGELKAMVKDAIQRIDVEVCDADPRTFRLDSFTTDRHEAEVSTSGEASVEAALLLRESERCRVEFETRSRLEDGEGIPDTSAVTLRIITDTL